jgi:hypothetical protein
MSDLTHVERRKFERLLGMGTGYVLGFSNSSFQGFVTDSTGKDVYGAIYDRGSGSKANRLRAFWSVEPNHVVAKLLGDLLEDMSAESRAATEPGLFSECERIIQRLRQGGAVAELASVAPIEVGREFEALVNSVHEAINRNEPETGLDRLHTYTLKLLRVYCQKHGIAVGQSKPLHSLMGEYRKKLKEEGPIESEMTEQILKTTTSLLQAFCDVRNDQSLAHDNPILNYEESLLIFNQVTSAIRFIRSLEERTDRTGSSPGVAPPLEGDDVPF